MAIPPPQPTDEGWTDCPAGEIGHLVDELRNHHRRATRRQSLKQAATGVSALAILILTGVYAVPHFALNQPEYGGIACVDVLRQADEYIAGRLEGGTAARIDVHLNACEQCRIFVTDLRQRTVPPAPDRTADRAGGHNALESFLLADLGN